MGSNHFGIHQIRSPTMVMSAGTSSIRTRNASAKTPMASSKPIDLIMGSSSSAKPLKTPIMITAAAETTRALCWKPSTTAARAPSRLREPWTNDSRIRVTRKTS